MSTPTTLAWEAWGPADAPVVLCLHGVRGCAGRFRFLAARLGCGARVIALDLPGHGRSTWLPPWDLATCADHALATVRALALTPAVWVGHSFGARVLLEIAGRGAGAVERAALLDPAFAIDPAFAQAQARAACADPIVGSVEAAVQARFDSGAVRLASPDAVAADIGPQLDAQPGGGLRFRFEPAAVVTAWSELARPSPPLGVLPTATVVVIADHGIVAPSMQARLAASFDVRRVPGGHNVFWDAPTATADAVATLLPTAAQRPLREARQ